MPDHMEGPVTPVLAWMKKVSHRNAPGAMSAIAFIVRPVRPSVGCILTSLLSAIVLSPQFHQWLLLRSQERDYAEEGCRLCLGATAVLFLKKRLVGPVGAELAARHQPVVELVLAGESEFLDGLDDPGRES